MAVVPRKRAGRVVYGVLTSVKGVGKFWELVGPNRREAERIDSLRKREVKAGTFTPRTELTDAASVEAYARRWLDKRRNRTADNDHALITKHVLSVEWFARMPIGQVRPRHVHELIRALSSGKLSSKSVSLVMGVLSVMFRDAVIAEVIAATPYMVPRGMLKRSGKKREPYTVAEAAALMAEPVGERERVWNAIAFYTGARCGEICGLRWGDWDEAPKPLGALVISKQYDGEPLKTDRPRIAPVHPRLAATLAEWRKRWSLYFLRRPGPEDHIVPRSGHEGAPAPLTKSSAYKAWIRSCRAARARNRSVHSTRHTFITVARRNGAEEKVVELVTHNAKGTMVDRYTTRHWLELCRAVEAVSFDGSFDGVSPDGSNSRLQSLDSNHGERAESRGIGGNDAPGAAQGARLSSGDPELDAGVDARRSARLRRLEALAEADPDAARPGLAVCRALDLTLGGDTEAAVELLRKEARRVG